MDNGGQFQTHIDVNDAASFAAYTDFFDATGHLLGQTGLQDDGDRWANTYENGHLATRIITDANVNEPWARVEQHGLDAATGRWAETIVFNDDGTSVDSKLENDQTSNVARTDDVRDTNGHAIARFETLRDGSQIVEIKTPDNGDVSLRLDWNGDTPDVTQIGGPTLAVPLAAFVLEQVLLAFGAAAAVHEYGVKPFLLMIRGVEAEASSITRVFVGTLTEARVNQLCPDTPLFQAMTTATAGAISSIGMTPQAYGTAVH
jgi:hypothetical protein